MTSTYPPVTPLPWSSVHPRPFFPVEDHPGPLEYPELPSKPRTEPFHGSYTITTHIIPAAYPRIVPQIPLPEIPQYSANAQDRREKIKQLTQEIMDRQELYNQGKLPGQLSEKVLWNCVNRYAKLGHCSKPDGQQGVTLFLAHANGFPKEIWETTLKFLLLHPSASLIDEIWSWEAVQHGDSALLNNDNLSGIFDWMDNSRDIANFLLNYMPEVVSPSLPTHLPRLPRHVSENRKISGYTRRTLVTTAHSLGGCTSVQAALNFPALFSSIILVDPVIVQPRSYPKDYLHGMVMSALQRRGRWSSREEALRLFKATPFFAAWHPDVLRAYVDYGLTEDAQGGVRLKMSGLHEALVFANSLTSAEVWELLETLDEKIELRWVLPGSPRDKGIQGEQATRVRAWRRPANTSNVVIHSAGHLITQESPEELAREISDFLERKYRTRTKALL